MDFPNRADLNKKINNIDTDVNVMMVESDYQSNLLEQLKKSIDSTDSENWRDEPNLKIREIEKQKEFFWVRVYLLNDDDTELKVGDTINISYKPTNEKMEMVFSGYEKERLNRNYDGEVINYINEDDKSILICMVDLNRVNKESEDIPTIRTFFRNSRYYKEDLFYKEDIVISTEDHKYEYGSIDF